jgi:hypothetical protein
MNNSARQSYETVFHLITGQAAEEVSKWAGSVNTPLQLRTGHTAFATTTARTVLSPSS